MEDKKISKLLTIGLIIFVSLCLLGSGYFAYKMMSIEKELSDKGNHLDNANNKSNNQDIKELYEDTFSSITESGKVRVTGYATIDIVKECYDCENPKEYEYVYFHILNTESQDFINYVKSISGNTFIKDNSIGIGCVEDNILSYVNDSDEFGMKGYKITNEETNKILNSSKDNPVILELERFKLTGGSDAPVCYSHITNIKIVD